MIQFPDTFEFEHDGIDLLYGRGRIRDLGTTLDALGLERALVVTGSNVGANEAVMDPVTAALGDRPVSVFDRTTPEKLGETAFEGIEVMRQDNPDVLVGVGGGSSLDIARQMSVFAADGRSLDEYREAAEAGRLEPPSPTEPVTPVVVVPTTFAGADFSSGGSIEILAADESPSGEPVRTSGSNPPAAVFYDPDLYETTPRGPLTGSVMNGFNKGLETIYARNATPISDATAVRGLGLLHDALPNLTTDFEAIERAIVGTILVQFERRISVVHAFGHGFARRYNLQQGAVHAVVVPHVLRYLFEHVDARRTVLAEGLGIDAGDLDDDQLGERIVEVVAADRDALGLPTRLRDLDPVTEDDLSAIARTIRDDSCMALAPDGLDPTLEELEAVLKAAW